MKYSLERAKTHIQCALDSLEKEPEKGVVNDLIEACQEIDQDYEEFCSEVDIDCNCSPGDTYKNGVSLEYQIEAEWWHKVSLALRKIEKARKQ